MSTIAAAVVEDELRTVIRDYEDIAEEGVHHGWMDESYATQVRAQLLDNRGRVRVTGNQEDYWRVIKDPEGTIHAYATEADNAMCRIMDENHEVLCAVGLNWIIDDVKVIKKLPGMWIVQIIGVQI